MATPKIGDGMLGWLGATPMAAPQENPLTIADLQAGPVSDLPPEVSLPGAGAAIADFAAEHPNIARGVGAVLPPANAWWPELYMGTPEEQKAALEGRADVARKAMTSTGGRAIPVTEAPMGGWDVTPVTPVTPAGQEQPGFSLAPAPVLHLPGQAVSAAEVKALGEKEKKDQDELTRLGIEANSEQQKLLAQQDVVRAAQIKALQDHEERTQATANKYQTDRESLNEQLKNAPSINPDRYWHNKNGFQKGMSALAGFLFGLSGKGMDYLHLIDQEIERDVSAQKFDVENRRQQIGMRIGNLNSAYAAFRDSSSSWKSAQQASTILMYEGFKNQVDALTLKSGSKMAAVNGEIAKNKIDERIMGEREKVRATEKADAIAKHGADFQKWEAEGRMGLTLAKAGKGEDMKPAAESKIMDSITAFKALEKMHALASSKGVTGRAADKVKALFGVSSVREANAAWEAGRIKFGTKIFEGVLSPHEMDSLKEMFGNRTGIYDQGPAIKGLMEVMRSEALSMIEQQERLGRSTGTLRQMLQEWTPPGGVKE